MMTSKTVHWSIKMPSKDEIEKQVNSIYSSNFMVNIKHEKEFFTTSWKFRAVIGNSELI